MANALNAIPRNLASTMRFVLILREPVSRLLSWYNHELEDASSSSSVLQDHIRGQDFDEYARYEVAPRDSWLKTDNGVPLAHDKTASDLDVFRKMALRHQNVTRYPGMRASLRKVPVVVCDQPTFTKGVYLPFLLFFQYHKVFDRKQLMVVSMDQLVEQPKDMMRRITSHYGLPILTNMHRLIKTNERDSPNRVVQPRCETRDFLSNVYAPFNEQLYQKMHSDQSSNQAPSDEPTFPKFNVEKSVPCTHGKKALTAKDLGLASTKSAPRAPLDERSDP
jgi:hypothetical protein